MKINEMWQQYPKQGSPATPEEQQVMYASLRSMGIEPGAFYQELEMSSLYVNTHRDRSFSNAVVQLHSHSFYELLCCTNGRGVEYLLGPERYRLEKGDIVFVPPGVSHRPILPEGMAEPYTRDVLWLSVEFMRSMEKLNPDLPPEGVGCGLIRTAGTRWEVLPELFHRGVLESEARGPGSELMIAGNAMVILAYLKRASLDRGARPLKAETPELLDQVMAYIEAHYGEKISLSDTARQFYVSESTVSHLFRQKLGVSFYRCVTQRRLIAAKTLIGQGCRLEDVSRRVGFSDYSTFYRAFRQEYGVSPRQYVP